MPTEHGRRRRGLYLITPECDDTPRLLELVRKVLEARPALLQYRSKLTDDSVRHEQALALAGLCREAGVALIVNDSVELALAVGADGVHLGRDDGDLGSARARLGDDRIIGVSCYDEWTRARLAAEAGADYVAFGAVFGSATKPDAVHAPLSLVARAARALDVPVAAIGGITLDNVGVVRAAGADLLCVISDVFTAADPAQRAGEFVRVLGDT
ncbi:MAG TPA: thiamine phosphate synthase [Rhodocyclaceae bacterium]|nr:thiamine phosphate synthase [Rhodocyclaceae bacterium]